MNSVTFRLKGVSSYTSPLICGVNIQRGETIRLPEPIAARIGGLQRQTEEEGTTVYFFEEIRERVGQPPVEVTYDLTIPAVAAAFKANPQDVDTIVSLARGLQGVAATEAATDFTSAMAAAANFSAAPSAEEAARQNGLPSDVSAETGTGSADLGSADPSDDAGILSDSAAGTSAAPVVARKSSQRRAG